MNVKHKNFPDTKDDVYDTDLMNKQVNQSIDEANQFQFARQYWEGTLQGRYIYDEAYHSYGVEQNLPCQYGKVDMQSTIPCSSWNSAFNQMPEGELNAVKNSEDVNVLNRQANLINGHARISFAPIHNCAENWQQYSDYYNNYLGI